MTLHLVPVSQRTARECVERWHRHAGMAGRPVARHFDNGQTVEVNRVASDGTRNATSMLYAALARAAFALGYTRVITYTLASESGAALRGAGWRTVAQRPATPGWSRVSRPRDDALYLSTGRVLWEAPDLIEEVERLA